MVYDLKSVPGVRGVKYIEAPFDVILSVFEGSNLSVLSAEDLAGRRVKSGVDSFLSGNGSWVKEGVLYLPNKDHRRYLVRDSFVFADAKGATDAHRESEEFFVDEAYVLEYIQDGESVLVLDDLSPVPTSSFGEDERAVWLFGKNAGEYGEFLSERIEAVCLYFSNDAYVDGQTAPYANQLWLGCLGLDSDVRGARRGLGDNGRAFGVLDRAGGAKRAKQTSKPPYTSGEVKQALKTVQGVREGKLPNSRLEKIIDLLEKL